MILSFSKDDSLSSLLIKTPNKKPLKNSDFYHLQPPTPKVSEFSKILRRKLSLPTLHYSLIPEILAKTAVLSFQSCETPECNCFACLFCSPIMFLSQAKAQMFSIFPCTQNPYAPSGKKQLEEVSSPFCSSFSGILALPVLVLCLNSSLIAL